MLTDGVGFYSMYHQEVNISGVSLIQCISGCVPLPERG